MRRIIALILTSLFVAGCALGVPVIDDQVAGVGGNAGGGHDYNPPDRKPPMRPIGEVPPFDAEPQKDEPR